MNDTLWYYRMRLVCNRCGWRNSGVHIFRGGSETVDDGDIINLDEVPLHDRCPKCSVKTLAGELDFPLYLDENPGVIFIWDERSEE